MKNKRMLFILKWMLKALTFIGYSNNKQKIERNYLIIDIQNYIKEIEEKIERESICK